MDVHVTPNWWSPSGQDDRVKCYDCLDDAVVGERSDLVDCCLSSRYVSENLKGRFILGSSHFPDSEASGRSVPKGDIRVFPI